MSDGSMFVKDDLGRMWKEAPMDYFKTRSSNILEPLSKNQAEPQNNQPTGQNSNPKT
jgi:hypothetical protein